MDKSTTRNVALGVLGLALVLWLAHAYINNQHADALANDPNPCTRPEIASRIMDSVSKIQSNNGVALQVTNMENTQTIAWQPNLKLLQCHATFDMSNGTKSTGTYLEKLNVAGQPVTQFTPDTTSP